MALSPRDYIGYHNAPPKIKWHDNAKIAVNFVLNYEEGSERNILEKDKQAETLFCDIPGPGLEHYENQRHLSSESIFEYGSRVGVWRLLDLFSHYQIPITL